MIHDCGAHPHTLYGLCEEWVVRHRAATRRCWLEKNALTIFLGECRLSVKLYHFYTGSKIICVSRDFAEMQFKEIER